MKPIAPGVSGLLLIGGRAAKRRRNGTIIPGRPCKYFDASDVDLDCSCGQQFGIIEATTNKAKWDARCYGCGATKRVKRPKRVDHLVARRRRAAA